jgi:hypothetical protein
MLVMTVVAIASVLGFVMLSSASLQNRAGANEGRQMSADYLAESGINLAMYYLQYPENAPALNVDGYWSGTGGAIGLASSIDGTVNVTVTRDASDKWTYEIVSAATAGTNSNTRVTRTGGARVYVRNEYQIKHAGAFNNNASVPVGTAFTGDVWSYKSLGLKSGVPSASVSGVGYCKTATTGVGWVNPAGGFKAVVLQTAASPDNTLINLYKTYIASDVTYNCDVIPTSTASLTGSVGTLTKTTSATNPAGIWYRNATSGGAFVLNDNVTINGTLVVEGDLQIKGTGIVITPQAGYPALIVTGTLEIFQPSKNITTNGATYVGTILKSNGTPLSAAVSSIFNVNGGLLIGTLSGTPVSASYNVVTVVKYDATKAKAPDLTSSLRTATGVSIQRWGLP